MKARKNEAAMKQDMFRAWTHILYRQGQIDQAKCSRMLLLIEKIKA